MFSHKEPLHTALKLLRERRCDRNCLYCYVLVGYQDDTPHKALQRLEWVVQQGATPFAMYYRSADDKKEMPTQWSMLTRLWTRPAIIFRKRNNEPEMNLFE